VSLECLVLDTSAVTTLIEGEAGEESVDRILREADLILPWVSVLEVAYVSRRKRGEAEADFRYTLLKQLSATILWELNEPLLLTVARFKANHRLSFGDALITAYAFQNHGILLHKDPEFEPLGGQIDLEALPYK
jgi:predicted nucleic acid-binding protein